MLKVNKKTINKVSNIFKTNSKYQTPERCQVDYAFQVNFETNFFSRSSVFIVNFEHVIAWCNKLVFN